ncbi:hypothetical protein PN498_13835 [Oscillatoria sp. CS-180]|uniref:hypothetical protein n=1 Tax=Oscillatoria sp. CS-180 TaxID=3021720 RepID=UPI00232CFAFF|nr:hypothetical protein [Oscillatoria sp. CS-180]MDB9527077.1 hypothetical protein [Oscillatoria sp. CS-180]
MANYYPWKIDSLKNFLELEMCCGRDLKEIANRLSISSSVLKGWLTPPYSITLTITFEQIRAIAHYRGWSIDKTLEWLEIGPAHLKEILERQSHKT